MCLGGRECDLSRSAETAVSNHVSVTGLYLHYMKAASASCEYCSSGHVGKNKSLNENKLKRKEIDLYICKKNGIISDILNY